jgi:hypothetical protein
MKREEEKKKEKRRKHSLIPRLCMYPSALPQFLTRIFMIHYFLFQTLFLVDK